MASAALVYKARQRRSLIWLGVWLVLALSVALAPQGVNLSMAMAFPGAGFWPGALAGYWMPLIAALLCHALFALAILLWFGSGNLIAPPLVWGITVLVTLWMQGHNHSAPAPLWLLVMPFLLWPAIWFGWRFLSPRSIEAPDSKAFTPSDTLPVVQDNALDGLTRFALDRALQPLDAFEGFQFVDQFQTAALRYQLNQTGYALALLQRRLPAFRGYLHQAQVNLILKAQEHRVWRYWQWENMWGNLSRSPDPVARDNIMFTGFLAAQIALFEAASGDKRFRKTGALTFKHPSGKAFRYDQQSLVAALHHGWDSSEYHLMPCEPNWIYPLCNGIGGCAARAHDPMAWDARAEAFKHALLSEFTSKDGTILPFRSAHTGIPAPAAGGAVVLAYPMLFWNTLFPEMARSLWDKARASSISNGALNTAFFWKVDTGDYRRSRAISYAGFAAAAAEMGDENARDLALRALEREIAATPAPWHREEASVFAHMTELIARLNTGGALRDLFEGTHDPHTGPYIDTQDRNVLVRKAEYKQDLLHLELELLAPSTLPLRGYNAGATLTVSGNRTQQITADETGCAQLTLDSAGAYDLRIST